MLEIKKEINDFDAFVIKADNGKFVRTSKAFASDGQTRKYITLHLKLLAKRTANGKKRGGGQLGTIVKNVWQDRHRVLFDDIVAEIKAGNVDDTTGELTDYGIAGNAYVADTKPYHTEINGVSRIGSRVRFFALEGESPSQVYESTISGLDFVKGDDDIREEDIKESTKSEPPSGSGEDDI